MKLMQPNTYDNRLAFQGFAEAKRYANRIKLYNIILNKKIYNYNLDKLEGIQEGLTTFEGLSIKQIIFALTDLHSINLVQGCKNHCLHCYANAQSKIKRASFETFKQLMDDISVLRKRIGINPISHRSDKYIDLYFDSDAMELHLYSKDGEKHDAIELTKIVHNSTGAKSVFDTNGWDRNNKKLQEIAEDYVIKLSKKSNAKHFYQINLSLNPFNPKYIKAVKDGYNPKEYSPLIPIDEDEVELVMDEKLKKAEKNYREYVQNEANMLFTFTPLLLKGRLSAIVRGLSDNITAMDECKLSSYTLTLRNILEQLRWLYIIDFETDQKFIKSERMVYKCLRKYEKLLNKNLSTFMFSSGRMEKFYKLRHKGEISGIDKIDISRVRTENNYSKVKQDKKLSATDLLYLKLIGRDGKLYLYDNYSVIPTDITLSTKEPASKLHIKSRDFVLKTDMIDII